ncbi:MAG: hypothetical protein AAB778_03095 [Patescibacteria group bacterium]
MNLIPSDMAVPAAAVKLAKLLNKISTISALVLLLTILSVGGLFFYFSSENSKQATRIFSLKAKINSLQQNEQKLILAKDRLAKIALIQQSKSVNKEILRFKEFSNLVSTSGSKVTEASLGSKGTEVTLLSENSEILAQILKPLSEFIDYKTVILSSLSYNAGTGFISTIALNIE